MKTALVSIGAVAVLGTAVAFAWSGNKARPDVDVTASTTEAETTPPVIQADVKFGLNEGELTDEEKKNTIVLPGGLRLPALNGCTDTDKLGWPVWTSRTPVVELVHGPTFDMYKHADGTLTTTQLVKYPDGKWAAAAMHMKPIDPLPEVEFMNDQVRENQVLPRARAAQGR